MKILGVIPARYASKRFPGKVLALLCGEPVLTHVIRRAQAAKRLSEVVVATDDRRIAEVAERFCPVVMTDSELPSGTDRVAAAIREMECDAVVNIQGDEPMMAAEVIDAVAEALQEADMTTAAAPIRSEEELRNPNVVKVVCSLSGRALYFSRYPIPYCRDEGTRYNLKCFSYLRHIGIYGYRRETLFRLVQWPPSALEQMERLEQLRALEHDVMIRVCKVEWSGIGIDVPEDLERAEAALRKQS